MKFLKRLLDCLIRLSAVFVVELIFGDVWKLRNRLQTSNNKILERIYYGYLEHYGAWIGLGAVIDGCPILPHGLFGIFISNSAHIGKNVVIFHQVTIGSNMIAGGVKNGAPSIGNNVYIGCGAKLIGNITIGDNARIGANCIVVKDVQANSVAVTKGTVNVIRDYPLDNRWVANIVK